MPFPKDVDEMIEQGYERRGEGKCKACPQMIEWWRTPNLKDIPMNKGTVVPHWTTCPRADDFRKKKKEKS